MSNLGKAKIDKNTYRADAIDLLKYLLLNPVQMKIWEFLFFLHLLKVILLHIILFWAGLLGIKSLKQALTNLVPYLRYNFTNNRISFSSIL